MKESSNLDSCVIELHYCLNDGSHSMDAFIFNKCEREFLAIVREITKKLDVEVEIEKEALGQGGLLSFFAISTPEILTGIHHLIALAIAYFISGFAQESGKNMSDFLFRINSTELQNQITGLNEKLDNILEELKILNGTVLKRSCSNYYKHLNSCKKVEKLDISIKNKRRTTTYYQHKVERSDFSELIISDDGFGPFEDDEAIIEITSPVIKGKGKWAGIYNGEEIHFKLCDRSFINKVQTGQISFREGSSIICHLVIRKKIDNGGRVRVEYEVIYVVDFQC